MIAAVDFDGVIHPYTQGYQGPGVFEAPYSDTREALLELKSMGYGIVINTCRGETDQIKAYMKQYDLYYDKVNCHTEWNEKGFIPNSSKIHADVYIDDRSIRHNGDWLCTLDKVMHFVPWYRKTKQPVLSTASSYIRQSVTELLLLLEQTTNDWELKALTESIKSLQDTEQFLQRMGQITNDRDM